MIRGRSAERAVQLAAKAYEKQGRALIAKQATPMRKSAGTWKFARKSPIDFRGTLTGGKSIALEVKEHAGASFPLSESTLSTTQRNALDAAAKMYGEVWLIVDLTEQKEVYAVLWSDVRYFLDHPYRHSLSLQWFRAIGLLCNESRRGTDEYRIWFLDRNPHPLHAGAWAAESAERESKPIVDLDAPIEKPQTRAHITKEERLAGIRDAINNGKYRKKAKGWI